MAGKPAKRISCLTTQDLISSAAFSLRQPHESRNLYCTSMKFAVNYSKTAITTVEIHYYRDKSPW